MTTATLPGQCETTEFLVDHPVLSYPQATVACFDATSGDLPRRTLDTERNIAFLEKLARLDVPALLIAASTGHGHARTLDELEEWYRSSAQADLGNTALMALLRPEDGLAANRQLITLLKELGYQVLFVRPGTDLSPPATDDAVVANMQPIVHAAADVNVPVGVYSIPDVSGCPLSPEAVVRLADGPGGDGIVAVKVTEADYQRSTLKFLSHPRLQRLKVVQGWDPHIAQALRDGPRHSIDGLQRCGVTSGPMSFAVYQYLHILDAAERADWTEVADAQQAVTSLFESMQDDPAKFADLQRAKFIMGLGHPLTDTVTEAQAEQVFVALESLPRREDQKRLAQSLDLMGDGPYHERLAPLYG